MAKTPQAKAAQAAVAVKRRKSSGANAARDKLSKGERQPSKPEEEEEKKDDKQDKDDQADKAAERDGAGNDDRNEDKVAKSASEAKRSPKTGKNAAKDGAAESAQDKEHPSKVDDIAKPSEEDKQESQSKPAPNTTKKRAAPKTDPKTSDSSKDDGKAPPSKKPKKEQRQGTRQSSRSTNTTAAAAAATNKANGGVAGEGEDETGSSSSRGKPNKAQLLRYLISPEAERLCRPDDEEEALSASDSKITKTYGGPEALSPFEELISAMILSRPVSHRLGLRTIRTVLNEPYEFSSAKRVQDAGDEKRHQALWDAKTQHKDKTAAQLGLAGDVVLAKYCRAANTSAAADGKGEKGKSGKGGRKSAAGAGAGAGGDDGDAEGQTLAGLVAQSESDIDDLLATLQSDIKGFGKTAAAIFRRRIQWAWEFAYPYVDERTADGLKDLGLPIRAEPLVDLVEEHWGEMKAAVDKLAGNDEETRKRRAFTIILERATNARLEGKVGDVLAAAAKS